MHCSAVKECWLFSSFLLLPVHVVCCSSMCLVFKHSSDYFRAVISQTHDSLRIMRFLFVQIFFKNLYLKPWTYHIFVTRAYYRHLKIKLKTLCYSGHMFYVAGIYFPTLYFFTSNCCLVNYGLVILTTWLGSWVVSVLDSGAERPGFKSQPRCCRVTVLGKLFTPIVPLFTKQWN